MLSGNCANALSEPNTPVMSRTKAEQYFPGEDSVGKTLIIDNRDNYIVTGVFEDFPTTPHFKFDLIFSTEGLSESKSNDWLSSNFNTYVLLREGSTKRRLESLYTFLQVSPHFLSPGLRWGFNLSGLPVAIR